MAEIGNENRDVISLNDLNLIKKTKAQYIKLIQNVPAHGKLIVKKTLFNPEAKIKFYGHGPRIVFPIFRETYFVDTTKTTVTINDTENSDGKYRIGIGQGDDAIFSFRLKCVVPEKNSDLRKLMINKEKYKSELRDTAEIIMKLLISDVYAKSSHDTDLGKLVEIKNEDFDFRGMKEDLEHEFNEAHYKVLKKATEFYKEYGIAILSAHFTDADESQRTKDIKQRDADEAAQRELAIKAAENKKEVRKLEAEAENIWIEETIKKLRAMNVSEEKIIQYITLKTIQNNQNAIISIGGNNNNMADYMSASAAINNRNQNNNQNTDGRSK